MKTLTAIVALALLGGCVQPEEKPTEVTPEVGELYVIKPKEDPTFTGAKVYKVLAAEPPLVVVRYDGPDPYDWPAQWDEGHRELTRRVVMNLEKCDLFHVDQIYADALYAREESAEPETEPEEEPE